MAALAQVSAAEAAGQEALLEGEYVPKNIFVTGGAGFIASHVCILLAKKYPQFKIVNFDRLDCTWPPLRILPPALPPPTLSLP